VNLAAEAFGSIGARENRRRVKFDEGDENSMGLQLPRTLRVLLGGALIAFAFAPPASADTGTPVSVTVSVQATGTAASAAVTATATVDVPAPAAPTAAVSVEAGASIPEASTAVPAAPQAPAARAEVKAEVKTDVTAAPAVSARADTGGSPVIQVAATTARAEEPAAARAATPVAQAPRRAPWAGDASSAGPRSLARRARPEASLPSSPAVSAMSAVVDAPPAGPPAAVRGSVAPVPSSSDSAGRRRVSKPAPAPFFDVPGPPSGATIGAGAAAWVFLLFALAAGIALVVPTLRRMLPLRRVPVRSSPYRLLLERPG
jgi:hypothetical protein